MPEASSLAIPCSALLPCSATTLPSYDVADIGLDSDVDEWYPTFRETLEDEFWGIYPRHQSLGHPSVLQGVHPSQVCEAMSGLGDGSKWVLLVQLDSDANLNLEWGDAGKLGVWVRSGDLEHRRFDRAWMVVESW